MLLDFPYGILSDVAEANENIRSELEDLRDELTNIDNAPNLPRNEKEAAATDAIQSLVGKYDPENTASPPLRMLWYRVLGNQ